jgi:hypothetical protein
VHLLLLCGVPVNIGTTSNTSEIQKVKYLQGKQATPMEAFLGSLNSKNTKSTYKRGIELFATFYGKTIDEILAERKDDLTQRTNEDLISAKQRADRYEKLLEEFWVWLKKNGYDNVNTRYSFCKGLRQLFRYYNMSLTLRNGSPINQVTPKINDFHLEPVHVKKMFHVAKDLRSKLLVSIGNDLGWRISDVLSIKRSELPDLDQEPPIEWMRITEKEQQVSKTCLSKTTVTLLKEYLFTFPEGHNPYVFFNNGSTIDDATVNSRLKDLAQEAGIKLGNLSLSWHCFRKMFISSAKNLSIDPDIIRLMVGKSVDKAMFPYLTGIDVKTAFTKLQAVTGLTIFNDTEEDITKTLKEEMQKLDAIRKQIELENANYKFRVDSLQKDIVQQQKQILEQNEKLTQAELKSQENFQRLEDEINALKTGIVLAVGQRDTYEKMVRTMEQENIDEMIDQGILTEGDEIMGRIIKRSNKKP